MLKAIQSNDLLINISSNRIQRNIIRPLSQIIKTDDKVRRYSGNMTCECLPMTSRGPSLSNCNDIQDREGSGTRGKGRVVCGGMWGGGGQ